jgi:hypothetical protein
LVEENKEVTMELKGFFAILQVALIDGDGTWPELGFQCACKEWQ